MKGAPSPPLHRPWAGQPQPGALHEGLTIPCPHHLVASQIPSWLWAGGQGAWRAWARGHRQHRISFRLCKDSLTPEHINILNDSERSRTADARAPHPHSPPSLLPLPPLLPHSLCPLSLLSHACLSPSLFSFPLSLSCCLSSLSSILAPESHLASPPHLSPPLPLLLPLPGPHSSPAFANFHPAAQGAPAGPVPLSVCPSPAGPPTPSQEAGPCSGAQGEAASSCRHSPLRHTHTPAGALCPKAHQLPPPSALHHAGKLKSQVWVWGAVGEGRVLGRIFCFVFFMTIYNFAFLPSAPASLAPRCVPH